VRTTLSIRILRRLRQSERLTGGDGIVQPDLDLRDLVIDPEGLTGARGRITVGHQCITLGQQISGQIIEIVIPKLGHTGRPATGMRSISIPTHQAASSSPRMVSSQIRSERPAYSVGSSAIAWRSVRTAS